MSGKFVKAQNSISMDQPELNLREWAAQAKTRRHPAISRRFSGSYITSTASSPRYPFPALQARSLHSWECFSLDGFTLNSKWNEAEKYICNPLSGDVPLGCLSAKSLSGRSFTNLIHTNLTHTNKQTMPCSIAQPAHKLPIPEKKVDANAMTREVGTQSISMIVGSNSPSPASTPPIVERALKLCESNEDSTDSNSEVTSWTEKLDLSAGDEKRNGIGESKRRRKGRTKRNNSRREVEEARRMLVMDEEEEAERGTEIKKKEVPFTSKTKRVLKMIEF